MFLNPIGLTSSTYKISIFENLINFKSFNFNILKKIEEGGTLFKSTERMTFKNTRNNFFILKFLNIFPWTPEYYDLPWDHRTYPQTQGRRWTEAACEPKWENKKKTVILRSKRNTNYWLINSFKEKIREIDFFSATNIV